MSSVDQRAGYTLVETVAVMAIVALIAALAIMQLPGTGRVQLKGIALDAAALLRRERSGAVLTGRERRVLLDGEARALIGDGGRSIAIPTDVSVDLLGVNETHAGKRTVVRFHPDGAATGAVLMLSRERAAYEIRINWFTGAVAVEAR